MPNVSAKADFEFWGDKLDYGSTQTADPLLFSVLNQSGNERLDFHAFPIGGVFGYIIMFGVGQVPNSGWANGLTIKDAASGQILAEVTGLSLNAAGNLDGDFSGNTLYPSIFSGNDTFTGDGHAVSFAGDHATLTNTPGVYHGGDDVMSDGAGAANGRLAGDVFSFGASTPTSSHGQGSTAPYYYGGDDHLRALSNHSTLDGDAFTMYSGHLFGGDDKLYATGDSGNHRLVGDVEYTTTLSTVIGGDDLLVTGNSSLLNITAG